MTAVQSWNVYRSSFHEPVVGREDAGDGSEEDGKAGHEGEEGRGGGDDLPGYHDPACGYGGEDDAATGEKSVSGMIQKGRRDVSRTAC